MIGFPKPMPHIFAKRDAQRDADRQKWEVYAAVDARDLKTCRCCGRRGNPYATDALRRMHRHHLLERGRDGGPMVRWNLLSLCALCHSLAHAKQLIVIGTNADERVTFEIHEAAVVEVFGTKTLPGHVRMVA